MQVTQVIRKKYKYAWSMQLTSRSSDWFKIESFAAYSWIRFLSSRVGQILRSSAWSYLRLIFCMLFSSHCNRLLKSQKEFKHWHLQFFKLSWDKNESLVLILVSWEGGNLLLSSTVSVWVHLVHRHKILKRLHLDGKNDLDRPSIRKTSNRNGLMKRSSKAVLSKNSKTGMPRQNE